MMTGKEMIMYILENNLENEDIFKNGTFLGAMSIEESAIRLHVGTAVIKAWVNLGFLDGITINGFMRILPNNKYIALLNNVSGDEDEKTNM